MATIRLLVSSKVQNIFGVFIVYAATLPFPMYFIAFIFNDISDFDFFKNLYQWHENIVLLMFHIFGILMVIVEIKRRHFLKFLSKNWYIVFIALILDSFVMYAGIEEIKIVDNFAQEWLYLNASIIPIVITIVGIIILKQLQRKYRAEANDDESDQPNVYVDINRDEKNLIFQYLFLYSTHFILRYIYNYFNIDTKLYGLGSNGIFIIMMILMEILLISYVDERINLSIIF
ncbi:hypothetical protein PVAND_015920 [Polypedilum vanderplanki]|uniref:Uncharacterized protein n=1 Tax=Polypedilum vanderplanki TaxID=319348 RepID=A0A9J6BDK4_POLVA|nr:hypothetical protein PVAND_015920 [Polypedilum vanderplanki]